MGMKTKHVLPKINASIRELNQQIAIQLTTLLKTDENALEAYQNDDFASEFITDLNTWDETQLVKDYYFGGLKKIYRSKTIPFASFQRMLHEVDLTPYKDNDYLKMIPWNEKKFGSWELSYGVFPAYQPFLMGDVFIDSTLKGLEITSLGFARHPFLYPCLLKNDSIWMSVTPFEIETMKQPIERAHGSVLTLGCGMGYFAFMVSQKESVSSVTIIENDPFVIELFQQEILPHFPFKEKIYVVLADGIAYLQTNKLDTFNYVFIDIYQTVEDGLPLYITLKKLEAELQLKAPWVYWLETSMKAMSKREK